MSDPNQDKSPKNSSPRKAASRARNAADTATAPAAGAAKAAAGTADDAASAVRAGAERSAAAVDGAARTAVKGVEAGRQAVITTSGHVAAGARTAWTALARHKLVAAGVGAGLTAIGATAYAAGHRAGRATHGPLTRLTGGRI
ncbi:hypothetical protein [Streptomyces sp. TP-A0875]|uniref:hypothetical protein n=1 Tax=Streptomyces sp. TP-A0875 TaxID=552354 RepID=UPI0006B4BEDE|nr:hypothetical protein [Streptomyces sp. TP-A0875]